MEETSWPRTRMLANTEEQAAKGRGALTETKKGWPEGED